MLSVCTRRNGAANRSEPQPSGNRVATELHDAWGFLGYPTLGAEKISHFQHFIFFFSLFLGAIFTHTGHCRGVGERTFGNALFRRSRGGAYMGYPAIFTLGPTRALATLTKYVRGCIIKTWLSLVLRTRRANVFRPYLEYETRNTRHARTIYRCDWLPS